LVEIVVPNQVRVQVQLEQRCATLTLWELSGQVKLEAGRGDEARLDHWLVTIVFFLVILWDLVHNGYFGWGESRDEDGCINLELLEGGALLLKLPEVLEFFFLLVIQMMGLVLIYTSATLLLLLLLTWFLLCYILRLLLIPG